jgi:hypothetical protein
MRHIGGYDGIYTTAAVSHYIATDLFQLAKTRFSPVVPPLTLDYAAKKIMHAILVCNIVFSIDFYYLFVYHVSII